MLSRTKSLENSKAPFWGKFVEWESANSMTFCLGDHTTTKTYLGCTHPERHGRMD